MPGIGEIRVSDSANETQETRWGEYRVLLRLTIPLAEPRPCKDHMAMMIRRKEGAGQGNLGGTGLCDSTEQDKVGVPAPVVPGLAPSHCLAAHKTASTLGLRLGCERKLQWLI